MATSGTLSQQALASANRKYSLSPEGRQLLQRVRLEDIMAFIYDTGYSICTEHCCTEPQIMPGRNREPSPSSEEDGFLENIAAINSQDAQERNFLGPKIEIGQHRLDVPRSVKLRQWYISPWPNIDGSDSTTAVNPDDIAEAVRVFVLSKSQLRVKGEDVLNFAVSYDMLGPYNGPVSPERNAFAQLRALQSNNGDLILGKEQVKGYEDLLRTRFEKLVLFSKPPIWFADILFWSRPIPGFDELSKLYLAWRKVWHTFVFCPRKTEELSVRLQSIEPGLQNVIPKLGLWGSVQNDYTLYHYQELTRKDLRYTYEHEPQCLRYMLENLCRWRDEVELLNDYVGLRRIMSRDHFHSCKSAMQRAGSAMMLVVEAESKVERNPNDRNVWDRERSMFKARYKFLEARAHIYEQPLKGAFNRL